MDLKKRQAKELLLLNERLLNERRIQIEKLVQNGQLDEANRVKQASEATAGEVERLKNLVSVGTASNRAESEFVRTAKNSQWAFSGTINLKRILFDGSVVRAMSPDGSVGLAVMADRNDLGSVFSGARETGGRNVFLFSPDHQKVIIFTTAKELVAELVQP